MNSIKDTIAEIEIEKLVTLAIATAFIFLVLSMTTCSIHDNMYNANEAKTEQAEVQGEIAVEKARADADMERIRVVQQLIRDEKVDPIAARCAVQGWDENTSDVCIAIVESKNPPTTDGVQ